jgi:hypothetical protein
MGEKDPAPSPTQAAQQTGNSSQATEAAHIEGKGGERVLITQVSSSFCLQGELTTHWVDDATTKIMGIVW